MSFISSEKIQTITSWILPLPDSLSFPLWDSNQVDASGSFLLGSESLPFLPGDNVEKCPQDLDHGPQEMSVEHPRTLGKCLIFPSILNHKLCGVKRHVIRKKGFTHFNEKELKEFSLILLRLCNVPRLPISLARRSHLGLRFLPLPKMEVLAHTVSEILVSPPGGFSEGGFYDSSGPFDWASARQMASPPLGELPSSVQAFCPFGGTTLWLPKTFLLVLLFS